jgi:hypothetical protein
MRIMVAVVVAVVLAQFAMLAQTRREGTFSGAVYGAGSLTCENWTIIKNTPCKA